MRLPVIGVLGLLAVFGAGLVAQSTPPPDVLLKAAMQRELTDGDLENVIENYRMIATKYRDNRPIAAQALLRLGGCYEKLGRAEALATYQRIVDNYADTGEIVAAARLRIAAIQAAAERTRASTEQGPFPGQVIDIPTENYMDFSPDGRLLAHLRRAGSGGAKEPALMIRDVASGTERAVATLPGNTRATRFSPDGRWLAAQVGAIPNAPRLTMNLVVARVAGDRPPIVLTGLGGSDEWPLDTSLWILRNWLVWSPDSRFLPYVVRTETVGFVEPRLLDLTTGQHRSLGARTDMPADFQWSPKGDELAFHVSDSAANTDEIRIVRPTTGEEPRVKIPSNSGPQSRLRRWTTRGQLVLSQFDRATQQYHTVLFEPSTGAVTKACASRIMFVSNDPVFREDVGDLCREVTADGRWQVTWKFATKRVMVLETSTGTERPLTMGAGGEERAAYLSPDGRTLFFISNRDGRWGLYAAVVDRAPVQEPLLIGRLMSPPFGTTPHWTRGGVVMHFQFHDSNIVRVPVDASTKRATGVPERLTQDRIFNSNPSLSPDGSRIAYWSSTGSAWSVSVMEADGSNERPIAEVAAAIESQPPAWLSTDRILVSSNNAPLSGEARAPRLMMLDARTGAEAPMAPTTSAIAEPRWDFIRATNEVIYRASPQTASTHILRARSISSGAERIVMTLDEPDSTLVTFVVSPDGKKVAYHLTTSRGRRIGVMTVDGSPTDFPTGPGSQATPVAWSADGRFLLGNGGGPVAIDTVTGESWLLVDTAAQLDWTGQGQWAPDGSFVVLTARARTDEWRQWQGVTANAIEALRSGGKRLP